MDVQSLPYALAWHDRLVEAARDYQPRGVRFFAVNSNDADRYPRDSYEAMRERVSREEWPFPYLHDPSQEAARAWEAKVTPHVYVLGPGSGFATRARPIRTTRSPRTTRPGCAKRWTRSSPGTRSPVPRPTP